MRLLTVNAEAGRAWHDNVPALAGLVADAAPDVVCVQECPQQEQAEALAAELSYSYRMGPSRTGLHTLLLWAPGIEEIDDGDPYAEKMATWHGSTTATLGAPEWPSPITIISAHLPPHSVQDALPVAQFLQTRVRIGGWPGIIAGDMNHSPLVGPEPDWGLIPEHNRASRTVLDPSRPDELLLDRRVGLALHRSKLADVAATLATATGDDQYLAPTGVHGRLRVDQIWITLDLVEAIAGYHRLDHREVTDHHPVAVDLDLTRLGVS